MDQQSGSEHNTEKAHAFFQRGQEVAAKGNFDYAINMYIEGLRCEPDDLKHGHLPLRELALLRQQRQGKKPSMVERMKYSGGKTPLEQMLNAEYLLAKAPEHISYAQAMLKAAYTGGFVNTTVWLADLLFSANNASNRPSVNAYILLKDAYASIGQFEKAIIACKKASELKHGDGSLDDEYKRLSAEYTMARGKYDQEGDFTKAIKDRDKQRIIQASDGVVKSDDFRQSLINDARKNLSMKPGSQQNILNLAKVLADTEVDPLENEAISLLLDDYADRNDFEFKKRADEIKINQVKRHLRHAKRASNENPKDLQAAQQAETLQKQLIQTELEHWQKTTEHYPTDLQAKYEYGLRLLNAGRHDEAIPLFQQAQRDPRRKIAAITKIGICFFKKDWLSDAQELFLRAIEEYEIKDDAIAKDLQYNLGLCYEKQGDAQKAVDIYRRIAQIDFGYRDVSKRIDALRNASQENQ
ncbi:MAG: tetratricopeptide repeat protein [Sedimentisphaerales bacterium]|nr:tetratricopeptide repeat protein [Sedimentisphaerales bacterium]